MSALPDLAKLWKGGTVLSKLGKGMLVFFLLLPVRPNCHDCPAFNRGRDSKWEGVGRGDDHLKFTDVVA